MSLSPFPWKRRSRKVMVMGLDCLAPELVFDRWREDLPNLRSLTNGGRWGRLRSSVPAITVPAWSSMLSSRDPGELGFYGFRNRSDHSYDKLSIAMGDAVRLPRVWNWLGKAGYRSIVLGVPQTYPVRPLKGHLVSGFLTPNRDSDFTYPTPLKQEILSRFPDYAFDVKDFRTDDKDRLLKQIDDMTRSHFELIHYMLDHKPWDFFMFVEIGVDRIHHALWHCMDPEHPKYEPGNPHENAIHDYYVNLDREIGRILKRLDDDTAVLVVSDHGAQRMDGGICINQWLLDRGYLALKQPPKTGEIVPFDISKVDWSRTRAWGSGGYYGRVFLNVEGREPQGIIPKTDLTAFREHLAGEIRNIPGPDGKPLDTRVLTPDRVYRSVRNVPPDMIVYFGNLLWRSVGSLGYDGWITMENDTGPDSCNHAEHGVFILNDRKTRKAPGRLDGAQLMDIAPTILKHMGVRVPREMQGHPIR